jgi:ATP-dependent phosphofructokinase / diphosphate-dependent phosphofructokinase
VPIMTTLSPTVEKDAHGNVQLSGTGALGDLLSEAVKDRLKIKRVRSDTFGYLQRSFMGVVSDVDQNEAREVGEKAVQFALWHDIDGSVTIQRTGSYSVDYHLTKLDEVAGKTRTMPPEFMNAAGNDVTEAFYQYARPLLGKGMPTAAHLRAPTVAKLLG